MKCRAAGGVLALCLLLSTGAYALPDTPYDPALLLVYPALTQAQQGLFDLLYAAAVQGQSEVSLPAGTTYDDASAAMQALLADAPELAHLDARYTISYYQRAPEQATAVTLRFIGDASLVQEVVALAQGAAQSVPGADWDKALQLHDWLCARTAYAEGPRAYDAAGALADGQAVCEGYAEAYALLCRMAGLRCGVLTGTAEDPAGLVQPHAWNEVVTAEGAMQVDVTWDDQDTLAEISRVYFGLTDAQMALDHTWEERFPRPACDAPTLDWHARQGQTLPEDWTEDRLRTWWETQLAVLARDRGRVDARFASAEQYELFLRSFEGWTDDYNARLGASGFYGSYGWSTVAGQCAFSLRAE